MSSNALKIAQQIQELNDMKLKLQQELDHEIVAEEQRVFISNLCRLMFENVLRYNDLEYVRGLEHVRYILELEVDKLHANNMELNEMVAEANRFSTSNLCKAIFENISKFDVIESLRHQISCLETGQEELECEVEKLQLENEELAGENVNLQEENDELASMLRSMH